MKSKNVTKKTFITVVVLLVALIELLTDSPKEFIIPSFPQEWITKTSNVVTKVRISPFIRNDIVHTPLEKMMYNGIGEGGSPNTDNLSYPASMHALYPTEEILVKNIRNFKFYFNINTAFRRFLVEGGIPCDRGVIFPQTKYSCSNMALFVKKEVVSTLRSIGINMYAKFESDKIELTNSDFYKSANWSLIEFEHEENDCILLTPNDNEEAKFFAIKAGLGIIVSEYIYSFINKHLPDFFFDKKCIESYKMMEPKEGM